MPEDDLPRQQKVIKKETESRKNLSRISSTEVFVVPPGIEPGTQGVSVLCSTN